MKKEVKAQALEFSDASQEEFINRLIAELLHHVSYKGELNGKKNRPRTPAELRALIVNHIEVTIQSALDDNRKRHLLKSGVTIVRKIWADAEKEIVRLESEINARRYKIGILEIKRRDTAPDLQRVEARKYANWGVGVISVAEGYFINEALRDSSVPRIPALVMAAGLATAIGCSTHIVAGWIIRAKTRVGKLLRYSVVLVPSFLCFAGLGAMRADAYNNIINLHVYANQIFENPSEVSWWKLTIPSFLLYVAVLLISVHYHKTEEERKREQQYTTARKEIETLEAEIEDLRKQQSEIKGIAKHQAEQALLRFEYAAMNECRFETYARMALELYKDTNCNFREDGTPEFYSLPTVFNLKFYFQQSKNNSYETNNVPTDGTYVH